MKPQTRWMWLVSACGAVLLLIGAPPAGVHGQEAHVGKLTGHAAKGKPLYTRYCAGCHGDGGDAQGENAQWLDPKPRDFTAGTFKCRSTPSGSLPTDQDLYNTVERGFVTTNMPPWVALTPQNRIDLVAYVKTFSPRWQTAKPGIPIAIPAEPAVTIQSILHGRELFDKIQCWKCHGPAGHGDGPSHEMTDSKERPIRPYNFSTGSRFMCGTTNQICTASS
jgi:cytochrome c oxidase cbb3-type subunit 2